MYICIYIYVLPMLQVILVVCCINANSLNLMPFFYATS